MKFKLLVIFLTYLLGAQAQFSTVANSSVVGTNDKVNVLKVDAINNLLYLGGDFTTVGGNFAAFIATWDGANWGTLGNGLNGSVNDILIHNGNVYACGNFTLSGADTMNYVAKWNGTSWESMGAGFNDEAFSLCAFNNTIYCGGVFTASNGSVCNRIAKWNGTSWDEVGGGVSYKFTYSDYNIGVYALEVYQGQLMVGGSFRRVNNSTLSIGGNVAIWNGFNWVDPGYCDLYHVVRDFVLFDEYNVVSAIGMEDLTYDASIRNYDGINWLNYPYADPLPHAQVRNIPTEEIGINALVKYDGRYYMGGDYTDIVPYVNSNFLSSALADQFVHTYKDGNFSSLATGLNNGVNTMVEFQGELYIGGSFTRTNENVLMNHLTRWKSPLESTVTSNNVSCNGGNDGAAAISIENGIAPYTYLWSDNSNSPTRSGLSAGTYTYTITDSVGRTGTGTVVISEPNPLAIQANITNSSSSNGAIDLLYSGGQAPYTTLWDHGPTTSSIANLSVGSYNVTVTDNAGCMFSSSFSVDTNIIIPIDTNIVDTNIVDTTTSILSTHLNSIAVQVYPNPCNQSLNMDFVLSDSYGIRLYSISGRLIQQLETNDKNFQLSTSKLENGVYILEISNAEFVYRQQVLKVD